MFTFPSIGTIEISPLYQFLVVLYAGIFVVVLVTNITASVLTFIVNHFKPRKKATHDK